MKKLIVIFTLGVVFCFAMLLFVMSPNKNDQLIDIPKKLSGNQIAQLLKANNVIYSKYLMVLVLKFTANGDQLLAGEFLFTKGLSIYSVIKLVTNPKNIYYHKFIVIEGSTISTVVNNIYKDNNFTGLVTVKLKEGGLMPNTYFFHKGQDRAEILKKMQKEMDLYLDALWKNKSAKLPYKNKEEALTLASIVEKESSYKDERALIAGVFLNRLKLKMKLQSDPTVAYGLGLVNANALTKKDLSSKTAYNTYFIKALPPTAIALPSKKSLDAVFNPQQTNYLYFVANGTGGHSFATNYADHLLNVKKWRMLETTMRQKQKTSSKK